MSKALFKAVNPVLPVKNVKKAILYYSKKLGFTVRGQDNPDNPTYAVMKRDTTELHLQWHEPTSFNTAVDKVNLRFVIENLEDLFEEYKPHKVFHSQTQLRSTEWGTKEFAFFDLDGNGLTFYKNL